MGPSFKIFPGSPSEPDPFGLAVLLVPDVGVGGSPPPTAPGRPSTGWLLFTARNARGLEDGNQASQAFSVQSRCTVIKRG